VLQEKQDRRCGDSKGKNEKKNTVSFFFASQPPRVDELAEKIPVTLSPVSPD